MGMNKWLEPEEMVADFPSLAKVMELLKPEKVMWVDSKTFEFLFSLQATISVEVDVLDDRGAPQGWAEWAKQQKEAMVAGMLAELIDIDKGAVLRIVQGYLEQVPSSAVGVTEKATMSSQAMQEIMDKARPPFKVKKEDS